MNAHRFHRLAALAIAGTVVSCSARSTKSDAPYHGPAFVLSTEGADDDVRQVLLEILQERMKPVHIVGSDLHSSQLGTVHVAMRVFSSEFQSTNRKETASIPRKLDATVTVQSLLGSSNWDGEHQIGFETKAPNSFSDSAATRRRFARRLLDVAVKQLPGRGVFKYQESASAQPAK